MTERSVLITGCSSGIGECCARGMKRHGWRVFATARKPDDIARLKAEGFETFYLDYTEPDSIAENSSSTAASLSTIRWSAWIRWPRGGGPRPRAR